MRISTLALKLVVMSTVILVAECCAWGSRIPVRGASNYGGSDGGFMNCQAGTDGIGNPLMEPCEDFGSLVGTVLVTESGGGSFNANIYQYVTFGGAFPGNPPPTTLDVIDTLGKIGASTTFSLGTVTPSPGVTGLPSTFIPSTIEVFSCGESGSPYSDEHAVENGVEPSGSGGTFVYNSSATGSISNVCTQELMSAPDITLNLNGSFTTGADFSLPGGGDLVLDNGAPPAPEPSSMLLLCAGLVAIGKFRRPTKRGSNSLA